MGVQGLRKLVDTSNILEDLMLSNSHLVIDAANMYYFLYFSSDPKLDQCHGGDYSGFKEEVCRFFKVLQNCKVTPHLVLDGGSSPEKLETLKSRLQYKLETARKVSQRKPYSNILPPLAKDVFKQILADENVEFEESLGEADLRVVSWANELGCPALSNDSDFYIYALNEGVLPLDQLQWKTSNSNQIKAKLYRRSRFCSRFKVDPALVSVFASIAGNDYSKLEDSGKFTEKSPSKSPQERLRAILRFLAGLDLTDLLDPKEKQRRALTKVFSFVGKMETQEMPFLKSIEEYEEHPETAETRGEDLPQWMRDKLKEGKLTSFVTDVIRYRRMMLTPLVEDFSKPSSYTPALRIRQLFYGLLIGRQTCTEFDRTNRNSVSAKEVSAWLPSLSPAELQQLQLEHLPQAPGDLRRQVLLEVLGSQGLVLENIPNHMKLQVCVTSFWWRHQQHQPIQYLHALLLGFIYGEHLNPDGEFEKKMKALKDDGGRTQLQLAVAHAYSQWQCCFRQSLHLNQLLCFPLSEPECSRLYCGSVLHQLVRPGPQNCLDTVITLMNVDQKGLFHSLETVCRSLEHEAVEEAENKVKRYKTS